MPVPVRRSVAAGTAVACLALSLGFNASAHADPAPQARLSSSLVDDLASATGLPMPVMVHGTDLAAARSAVAATGTILTPVGEVLRSGFHILGPDGGELPTQRRGWDHFAS